MFGVFFRHPHDTTPHDVASGSINYVVVVVVVVLLFRRRDKGSQYPMPHAVFFGFGLKLMNTIGLAVPPPPIETTRHIDDFVVELDPIGLFPLRSPFDEVEEVSTDEAKTAEIPHVGDER